MNPHTVIYRNDGSVEVLQDTHKQPIIIDKEDLDYYMTHRWRYRLKSGYSIIGVRFTSFHRIIMKAPAGMLVDHINHNQRDNRRSNLRVCTQAENKMNRQPIKFSWHTSKFLGVSRTSSGRWEACISVNNSTVHLGKFKNPLNAAKAYDNAAIQYRGEFACTNKSKGVYV